MSFALIGNKIIVAKSTWLSLKQLTPSTQYYICVFLSIHNTLYPLFLKYLL